MNKLLDRIKPQIADLRRHPWKIGVGAGAVVAYGFGIKYLWVFLDNASDLFKIWLMFALAIIWLLVKVYGVYKTIKRWRRRRRVHNRATRNLYGRIE